MLELVSTVAPAHCVQEIVGVESVHDEETSHLRSGIETSVLLVVNDDP